jgi:hypothetical protein
MKGSIAVRLDEAADWTGRSRRTLWRWVALGILEVSGQDHNGRDMYDLQQVLDVEHAMRHATRWQPHDTLLTRCG